jgi:hypothetical protein
MEIKFSDMIPHPVNPPVYNDIMWGVLFVITAAILIWRHRRIELSNTALIFIGSWSMFWQEYYNNWGGYLLYSPDLTLLPWGSTWWTSPNKPVFLIVSYPVFFTIIYSLFVYINRGVKRLAPTTPLLVIALAIDGPLFWLWNYFVDGASVENGIWNYMVTWGPTVTTANGGNEPLVWPMIPFAIFGAVVAYYLSKLDANGHPTYLQLGRPERFAPGRRRETVRALTAIIWWNAMFWFAFTAPLNLVRDLFLPTTPYIP